MQYAICPVRVRPGSPVRKWVVVLQHDDIQVSNTRFVAPLASTKEMEWVAGLHPRLRHDGVELFIAVDQAAAVSLTSIGTPVGTAQHLRDEITRALDLLFTGF